MANNADPDQTAPTGAVLSESTVFALKLLSQLFRVNVIQIICKFIETVSYLLGNRWMLSTLLYRMQLIYITQHHYTLTLDKLFCDKDNDQTKLDNSGLQLYLSLSKHEEETNLRLNDSLIPYLFWKTVWSCWSG